MLSSTGAAITVPVRTGTPSSVTLPWSLPTCVTALESPQPVTTRGNSNRAAIHTLTELDMGQFLGGRGLPVGAKGVSIRGVEGTLPGGGGHGATNDTDAAIQKRGLQAVGRHRDGLRNGQSGRQAVGSRGALHRRRG